MLNIPKARKVLEYLEANPEEHDQTYWGSRTSCGTTYCVAGATLMLTPEYEINFNWSDDMAVERDGKRVDIQRAATYELGLTHTQSHDLFLETSSNEDALQQLRALISEAEQQETKVNELVMQ